MTHLRKALSGLVAALLGGVLLVGPFLTDQDHTMWTVLVGGGLVVVALYTVNRRGMLQLWDSVRAGVPALEDPPEGDR